MKYKVNQDSVVIKLTKKEFEQLNHPLVEWVLKQEKDTVHKLCSKISKINEDRTTDNKWVTG